ncbi:MAG TPA: uridine kinase [Hyphomonadaceae bacterium]|nr:uridine kinase [Hyphomonadaceae bacterium]
MAKTFLIAITGGSGSGKTTLARAVQERLGNGRSVLLTEDNYYQPRAFYGEAALKMPHAELERTFNFDDPASKDMAHLRQDLEALKRGESIDQPVYNFSIHDRDRGSVKHIDWKPVVIVEGIHCLSDLSFLPLYDLTVFVDAPADLRLIRRIRRDEAERGRSAESVIQQYLSFVRAAQVRFIEPAKSACDIVVSCEAAPVNRNQQQDRDSVDRLVAPVWVQLQKLGIAP